MEKRCKTRPDHPKNITQNVNAVPQNVNAIPQNVNAVPQNVNVAYCSKCYKPFARNDALRRHEQTCDGYLTLQCNVCLKIFASRQGKHQHIKKTKCVPPIINEYNREFPTINNITTNTDNSTNITNNYIQQININVHGQENYGELLDTIRTKYPQAFLTMVNTGDTASLLRLLHFNNDFPENQTIRKTIKKDASAEVHVGSGKWEKRSSNDVIKHFKGCSSKQICNSLDTKLNSNNNRNDLYLKEVLYEETKRATGNTDSLLSPFVMNIQDVDSDALMCKIRDLKNGLSKEYPTLIGTPMFINQWKQESRPYIHAFENKWNTFVTNIEWVCQF